MVDANAIDDPDEDANESESVESPDLEAHELLLNDDDGTIPNLIYYLLSFREAFRAGQIFVLFLQAFGKYFDFSKHLGMGGKLSYNMGTGASAQHTPFAPHMLVLPVIFPFCTLVFAYVAAMSAEYLFTYWMHTQWMTSIFLYTDCSRWEANTCVLAENGLLDDRECHRGNAEERLKKYRALLQERIQRQKYLSRSMNAQTISRSKSGSHVIRDALKENKEIHVQAMRDACILLPAWARHATIAWRIFIDVGLKGLSLTAIVCVIYSVLRQLSCAFVSLMIEVVLRQ